MQLVPHLHFGHLDHGGIAHVAQHAWPPTETSKGATGTFSPIEREIVVPMYPSVFCTMSNPIPAPIPGVVTEPPIWIREKII